jgi:serine/threonine protein kinase
MFGSRKNPAPMIMEKTLLTRPDSPKVTRERKSRDIDPSSVRSPRSSRREKADGNMHKMIYDLNTTCWSIKYEIENSEYAKGAYGKILLATDKVTQQKVVIKKIPQTTPIRMVNNEVRAGKFLGSHPNLAALLQYIDKPDFHFLVFQYINGQDLFGYLEKLNFAPRPDSEAKSIITQIFNAMQHIHSHSIAHRDIKLENILIDSNGNVVVIDLGLCAFIEDGKLCRDWCGSDNYLAPEIVRRNPYDGYQADVFSAGVVLFALLFGVFPFENLRVNGISSIDPNKCLKKLQVRFPVDVKVSNSAKDLLLKMLEDDPEKRITLKDALKHEWVVGEDESRTNIKNSCESAPGLTQVRVVEAVM